MARTDAKPLLNDSANMGIAPEGIKDSSYPNRPGTYDGQIKGNSQPDKYAEPLSDHPAGIRGMDSLMDDIGEKSGFLTYGYIDKGATPYGEAAKFNFLPPGMDISNQENAEIHEMPLKLVTETGYGDGWNPKRDVAE